MRKSDFFPGAESSRIKEKIKKNKEVRASLTSLFLQSCEVPFNDHIFFHENALPFSGLYFVVILIIAWYVFLIPDVFFYIPHFQNVGF